jgi:hypothetical protein
MVTSPHEKRYDMYIRKFEAYKRKQLCQMEGLPALEYTKTPVLGNKKAASVL